MDKLAPPAVEYRVVHSTTYAYAEPVRVCHNIVMLNPRSDGLAKPSNYRIFVTPRPEAIAKRNDYFGNLVHTFALDESHRQLVVTASGKVAVQHRALPKADKSPTWEDVLKTIETQKTPGWLENYQYKFNSPRIRTSAEFADYARVSFPQRRPMWEGLLDLTGRIYQDFTYDTLATSAHTPTEEAFGIRKGVCQDFAHVQIACLRSLGLCARYVSGYLRTQPAPGKEKLVGADQSHAWLSVYCGRELGWIDVDPTNNKPCDTDHIPLAWGRDYNDVIPVRGVFLGGGKHTIRVSVDVREI